MPTRTTAVTTWVARLTERVGRHTGPHTADRIAAAVVLVASALALVVSVGYGLRSGNQIGPGFFPALVSAMLGVLSVIWLLQGDVAVRRPVAEDDDATASTDESIDDAGRVRILFVVVWSGLTAAFTERLGIVPVLTVYLTGLLIVVARARPIRSFVLSLVGTLVACYGLQVLGIFLPDPFGLLTVLTRLGIGP